MQGFPNASSDWVAQAGSLLGAGGLGMLLLKIVERIFARADRQDDLAVGLRAEMVRRLETLEKDVAVLREDRDREFRSRVRLESENRQLRQRYHALINWIAKTPELPTPPSWLYESVSGPTSDEGLPQITGEDA